MLLTLPSRVDSFIQFFTVLILFLFVLVLTYFTTKFIANTQKDKLIGNNVEVIETFRITQNKFIQIVRTGQKYIAIAVCKDTVTMLTEIPKEDLVINEKDKTFANVDFKSILEKVSKRAKKDEE